MVGDASTFLETIVRADPSRATRTSHQYVWDMLRWQGKEDENGVLRCALLSSELFGIDDSIARVVDYFKAAAPAPKSGGACCCCSARLRAANPHW